MDYETKIISKNEYNNLGDFFFEIVSTYYLILFCAILFYFIVIIYEDKKVNENAKKLNKSNDKYILKSKRTKNLDNPKINEIFDNDNDNDNDNNNENENGVSLINLRDEYSLNK